MSIYRYRLCLYANLEFVEFMSMRVDKPKLQVTQLRSPSQVSGKVRILMTRTMNQVADIVDTIFKPSSSTSFAIQYHLQ